MEQPAADEFAQHGDQIEITEPGRVDYGKRFQVETCNVMDVIVLDNRIRVRVLHTDYKVVKRCGKPASEAPKKVGRPSNAERDARIAAQVAACVAKPPVAAPKAPVLTKAELAALEKAIDVPVVRKSVVVQGQRAGKTTAAIEQVKQAIASGKVVISPFTEQVKASHSFPASSELAKRSPIDELEGTKTSAPADPLEKSLGVLARGLGMFKPDAEAKASEHAKVGYLIELTEDVSGYKRGDWLEVTNDNYTNGAVMACGPLAEHLSILVVPAEYTIAKGGTDETVRQSQYFASLEQAKPVKLTQQPEQVTCAKVGDVIKITGGTHIAKHDEGHESKYKPGTELRVTGSGTDVVNAREIGYATLKWNFVVNHGDYEIVSTASQEKALQDVTVNIEPASLKLTQEQFDAMTRQEAPKHSHYFKACPFDHVDVYRVLNLFGVVDPCLQHAVKKLLVAGGRRHKDIATDVQDSIDSLERWKAMRAEEKAA